MSSYTFIDRVLLDSTFEGEVVVTLGKATEQMVTVER